MSWHDISKYSADMGRTHRKDYPYAYHHVMNRAGAKRWVFIRDEHRQAFIEALQHVVKIDSIEIHAYCLMGNHFHLLIRSPRSNLSQAMQRLFSMFTRRFNRIEKIDGPLFRGRFKSIAVGQDEYLRELCRYIHRNPVTAGLVQHPSDYAWSSYQIYAGKREAPCWLTCQELPTYFQGPDHLLNMRIFIEAEKNTDDEIKEIHNPSDLICNFGDINIIPNKCLQLPSEKITDEPRFAPVSLQIVLECVAKHFDLHSDELLIFPGSISNIPRELSLFIARLHTGLKVQELANAFSCSRTSTSNAISRMRRRIEASEKLQNDFKAIMAHLRPPNRLADNRTVSVKKAK
jgi:putative transposase